MSPSLARQARDLVWDKVAEERERQDFIWGEQNHDPMRWLSILMEQVGEYSRAATDLRFRIDVGEDISPQLLSKLHTEAVHVAAVALAIVECLERGTWRVDKP